MKIFEFEPRKINVIDVTLREGMQTPGLVFSVSEKVKISQMLNDIGVYGIMVSYPPAHKSEVESIKAVMELKRKGHIKSEIMGHGRLIKRDADLIGETGAFVNLHFPLGFKPDDIGFMRSIKETIEYVKNTYNRIKVDLVDVASLDIGDLIKTAIEVSSAGADIICLPDTTGQLTPASYYNIIKSVRRGLDKEGLYTKICVHCHNDYGAAVANTIAGVYGGADFVEVTVGGLGERNGIADLATVCAILKKDGFETGINVNEEAIIKLYKYIARLVKERINLEILHPRHPIFGEYVSIHTAGTHLIPAETSLPSRRWGVSLTVYTGRHAIKKVVSDLGYSLSDDQIKVLTKMVKDLSAEKCREITIDELKELISKL